MWDMVLCPALPAVSESDFRSLVNRQWQLSRQAGRQPEEQSKARPGPAKPEDRFLGFSLFDHLGYGAARRRTLSELAQTDMQTERQTETQKEESAESLKGHDDLSAKPRPLNGCRTQQGQTR
mmetsp:Transcript_24868/g.54068  ORF Transcript_24868/g.54068 Transcript_24868/m.54068 type:complete len:122 (+) Transcript_24868:286-651(+)